MTMKLFLQRYAVTGKCWNLRLPIFEEITKLFVQLSSAILVPDDLQSINHCSMCLSLMPRSKLQAPKGVKQAQLLTGVVARTRSAAAPELAGGTKELDHDACALQAIDPLYHDSLQQPWKLC
mmetsp:Transcript_105070/g.208875  ORF Transcript_105070/g.208875 Transcript_105070/m.208875 type:complete len:122 (+) Transcript_105070:1022-1387(+)